MRKYIFTLICLVGSIFLPAATLQQAEDLYRQGHFASALTAYEELLQTYPNDAHLYYNIGNCYFKMGTKGLALVNYYKAFRLAPRDADIRHNLNLALQSSGQRLVPAGMPVVLHKLFFYLTVTELQGLWLLSVWLFCIVTAFWCWKRKAGWLAGCLLIGMLMSSGWYAVRYHMEQEPLAVVAAPIAELRSGPGTNFPASANVAQGHLVVLQDKKDNWREVIIKSQAIKGWLEENTLEKI